MFAQQEEKECYVLEGKMGIESRYNDILTGKNGKIDYSTDRSGLYLPKLLKTK